MKIWPDVSVNNIHLKIPYILPAIAISLIAVGSFYFICSSFTLSWHLPILLETKRYTIITSIILGAFFYILSLVSVIAFKQHHPERWKILIPGIAVIFIPIYLQQTLFKPIAPTLKEKIVSGEIVLQCSSHSCMAATASNIARQFNIIKSEKEMANLFGTTKFGTSASGFIKGMEQIGFTCEKVFIKNRDLNTVKTPAMLAIYHTVTGPNSHAVAYIAHNDSLFEIWDPLWGKMKLTHDQIQKVWEGYAVECRLYYQSLK